MPETQHHKNLVLVTKPTCDPPSPLVPLASPFSTIYWGTIAFLSGAIIYIGQETMASMDRKFALSTIIHSCLVFQCLAAPIADTADQDNAWRYGTSNGILGLAVLILDIIVFGMCYQLISTSDPASDSIGQLLTTGVSSRSPEVQSGTMLEIDLVSGRIPVPCHRHARLLGLFKPRRPQHSERL